MTANCGLTCIGPRAPGLAVQISACSWRNATVIQVGGSPRAGARVRGSDLFRKRA